MSKDELTEIHYQDVMAELASAIEQYGARKVFKSFREYYPAHFREMEIQIERLDVKPAAKLLTKD